MACVKALLEIICLVVPVDMAKSWVLTWFIWPIADAWGYFFAKDSIAEGIKNNFLECMPNVFTHEQSVCRILCEECMSCQGDEKVACKVIWAPSGTGKTFTLCNLMAEARAANPVTKYTRVDWKRYPSVSFGRDMHDWMQSQRQAKKTDKGYTVLFMDHFDDAMGKTKETKVLALELVQDMIDCVQHGGERCFTIICVNSLDNALALRDMQCNGNNRDCMRMVGFSIQENPCMMWKSREDAKRFADFAFGHTTPGSRELLHWGEGIDTPETQIEKLTELVINAGCVKYAVRFLRGDQPRNMQFFMQLAEHSKKEWEGGIRKLDLAFSGCA